MRYLLLFFISLLGIGAATASGFPDYIKSASVEKGELDVQYQHISLRDKDSDKNDHKTKQKMEAYYGLTDQWLILGGFKIARDYKNVTDLNEVYLGGAYQFMDAKDTGINGSVLAEYIHAVVDDIPSILETRLQFDGKWGPEKKFKTKVNLVLFNEFGDNRNNHAEFTTRLSTSYKLRHYFRPAFEWHAGYGNIDNIGSFEDEQEHYFGPAIYGEFEEFANGVELEYQIGYFAGLNDNAADNAIKFFIEYEYNF